MHLSLQERWRFWLCYGKKVQTLIQDMKRKCGNQMKQDVIKKLREEKEEYDDDHCDNTVADTNSTFGDIPNRDKGVAHRMMALAWKKNIHTIFNSNDSELIHFFYLSCVKNVVGRKRWSEQSDKMRLEDLATFSDEAYSMVFLESNVGKWLDEFREPKMAPKDRKRSLYTETNGGGREWSEEGLERFVFMCRHCKGFRSSSSNAERWKNIQQMVRTEEMKRKGYRGSRRRRRNSTAEGPGASKRKKSVDSALFGMANDGVLVDAEEEVEDVNAGDAINM